MSAYDTLNAALYGNPPTPGWKPSRDGVLNAFNQILTQIASLTAGTQPYATVSALPSGAAVGTSARVYADPTSTNNTFWLKGSGGWAIDTYLLNSIASVVQPLVDAAAASASGAAAQATNAGNYANAAAASATAAALAGMIFSSVAAGLAGTTNGKQFIVVPSAIQNGGCDVYLNSSGSATLVKTLSDVAPVTALQAFFQTRGLRSPSLLSLVIGGKKIWDVDGSGLFNVGSFKNVGGALQTLSNYFQSNAYNVSLRSPYIWRLLIGGKIPLAIAQNGDLIAKGGNISASLASLNANNATVAAQSQQLNGVGYTLTGDSEVQGAYCPVGQEVSTLLGTLIGQPVANLGRNSDTSLGVVSRMGVTPGFCVFPSNTINASGTTILTSFSNSDMLQNVGFARGVVQGVAGVMDIVTNPGSTTFTRTTAGTPVYVPPGTPFNVNVTNSSGTGSIQSGATNNQATGNFYGFDQSACMFGWMGGNEINFLGGSSYTPQSVIANMQALVKWLKPLKKRYCFTTQPFSTGWGTASSGSAQAAFCLALNSLIVSTFPNNYIDGRMLLMQNGDASANDNSDIANGWTPRSLRSQYQVPGTPDIIHLGGNGNALMARWFSQWYLGQPVT